MLRAANIQLIARARRGTYEEGSLRELPPRLIERGFTRDGAVFTARSELREAIDFRVQDLRIDAPEGIFDVILCRNVAFTYFDAPVQLAVAHRLVAKLAPGGVIAVGRGEALPPVGALSLRASGLYTR